jgi:hypothetical protein
MRLLGASRVSFSILMYIYSILFDLIIFYLKLGISMHI